MCNYIYNYRHGITIKKLLKASESKLPKHITYLLTEMNFNDTKIHSMNEG